MKKLRTLSRLLKERSRRKLQPKKLLKLKKKHSKQLKSLLMPKKILTQRELSERKRKRNSLLNLKNAKRSLMLKPPTSRRFKIN